jgi:DNA replication protein DnaC
MSQHTVLESYLRQLRLPTFAHNYAAFAADAARTGLSCERYLLALCEAELAQRDANRVERCIAQAKLPVLKELPSSTGVVFRAFSRRASWSERKAAISPMPSRFS